MTKYKDELLKQLNSCKYSAEKTTMRQAAYNAAISDACRIVDALPDADIPRWIPVTERLPDGRLNKSYLVQDKDGRRAVGTYTNWGWMFGYYMNDAVAWMPLPEPYKEGEEE